MKSAKIRLTAAAAWAALMFSPLAQSEGLSYTIGLVSLYKSKGLDQDSREPSAFRPVIQGGMDYTLPNGFYLGNWNSIGQFGDAHVEIDLYAGYGRTLSNGVSYDLGWVGYRYPNSGGGWNGNDLYGSVSYRAFTVQLIHGINGSVKKWSRLGFSIEQPLNKELTLNAGLGFRNTSNGNSGAYDYSVGLSYDLGGDLSTSASVSGAQTSKAGPAGKARLVTGVSKTF